MALSILAMVLFGCSGEPIDTSGSPPVLPLPGPETVAALSTLEEKPVQFEPSQVFGCYSVVTWYGYNACWRYTGVWYFTWPYGYNLGSCHFIIYYSDGEWGTWQFSNDWDMCNS